MTPAARLQAAIEVLGAVLSGAPAERELTRWARGARYAGAKDRAAVRDHVFDALRRLRSSAWLGGQGDAPLAEMDPRAVMAGLLRGQGTELAPLFDGSCHGPQGPPPPAGPPLEAAPDGIRLDLPDWALDRLRRSQPRADEIAMALRDRAPVHLRANLRRTGRDALVADLCASGYDACPHPLSPTAVRVDGAPRGLAATASFADGAFEMQDAGSQAAIDRLPLADGMRVLDLCAGGGGKALAMAARAELDLWAHDADPARLRDLPARAARAGVEIARTDRPEVEAPFDLVLCDVPCSGSGAWRRQAEARWRTDPGRLRTLRDVQAEIVARAARLLRPGGVLAYVTCSLFAEENAPAPEGLAPLDRWACTPCDGADGFFLATFR